MVIVPVVKQAKVHILYPAYQKLMRSQYINEFLQCAAAGKLLLRRAQDIPLIKLLLDTNGFQFGIHLFQVDAAGTAFARDPMSARRQKSFGDHLKKQRNIFAVAFMTNYKFQVPLEWDQTCLWRSLHLI